MNLVIIDVNINCYLNLIVLNFYVFVDFIMCRFIVCIYIYEYFL